MLRRLLVLLTLLISLAGAEEYHYYVGIVREPTRSYASSDTTEPESYIADGTICAFIQGMMFWSHPTSENGLIKIHVFNLDGLGCVHPELKQAASRSRRESDSVCPL